MAGKQPAGPDRQKKRGACGGRAVGVAVSISLLASLPHAHAALSISSGYETFLTQIRNRIVCAEDDVQEVLAQTCDSMKDGPFCRALPELGVGQPRHQPFTLDSIVPQHLFGDPRASMERAPGKAGAGSDAAQTEQATKQATAVLNRFLEHFSKIKEVSWPRSATTEGRLDLRRLAMGGKLAMPRSYSRGLPNQVYATWEGPWQVEPAVSPPIDTLSMKRTRRSRRPRAAVRLNGAIGSVRFNRPVVIRSLQMMPTSLSGAGAELWVRGRLGGAEVWRHAWGRGGACGIGELVMGRWEGDGQFYYARILTSHRTGATVLWIDRDPSHRLVSWEHLVTPAGLVCKELVLAPPGAVEWQDLARRSKAVDEIAFLSVSASQWLLGELHVAATAWKPEELRSESDSVRPPTDTAARVVQVLPGPHASIEEASESALFYNADDMLERGLRLKSWPGRQKSEASTRKASQKLQTAAFHSVEGLKQMVRSLMPAGRPSLRLPPHVSEARVLSDLDYLVTTLNVGLLSPEDQEKVVRRYGHFEIFFTDLWDWRAPVDSLQVLYEHWREDPIMQKEAANVFQEGQSWQGSYYCTQGRTKFSLDITAVKVVDGKEQVQADLTFTIAKKGGNVTGIYEVLGQVESSGRSLIFEPIPDSWKEQPKNFVMVGTQGVVSATDDGTLRHVYAGTVPIYGCDSFELFTEAKAEGHPDPSADHWRNSPFSGALQRLSDTIDMNRHSWRKVLQRLMLEKSQKPNEVAPIFEAARQAGLVSVEFTTGGEEIVLQLKR